MKVSFSLPGIEDLTVAYRKLQSGVPSASDLALYSQYVRFDPRIGELWVSFLRENWKSVSPMELNKYARQQPWPFTLGVLLDYSTSLEKDHYKTWKECALYGIQPAQGELFYFDHYALAGKRMQRDVIYAHTPYVRWGSYGTDTFGSKHLQRKITKKKRQALLSELMQMQSKIRVADYLRHINFAVSARQAERDLQESPRLKSQGHTRNRVYYRK